MAGIDRDVLETQCDVLTDARALHLVALEEAVALEARAMRTEHIAHDEAAAASSIETEAHQQVIRSRVIQAEQRRAIRECSADIREIKDLLETWVPTQRQPIAGS